MGFPCSLYLICETVLGQIREVAYFSFGDSGYRL